jgi:hypothetical protein
VDSKKIEEILRKGLDKVKSKIQSNLVSSGRNASGSTSKSLKVVSEVSADSVKVSLLGSKVLGALEFGRSPSEKGQKGKRTWEKELRDWMRLRGIDQSLFYPIWRKINRDGYKGTKGLVTDPIEEFKKEVSKQLSLQIVKDFRKNGINSNQ